MAQFLPKASSLPCNYDYTRDFFFSSNFYIWQLHCVWAAAEAYSAPSIVLTSHSHDGMHVFDDFREAYAWLRHNTEVDDKVQPYNKFSLKC